ncbi:MAG: phosphoglycerate dehydrogenase [Candidatus Latescibacterota bacterium]|jgi:D-3-phosphoglycerate dehydrogenase
MKVLIADSLADGWQDVFQTVPDIQVDVNTGLSEDDLCGIIGEYAGLIVRSATKVTQRVIEAGHNLKAIGRAGAGVDNIDLDAATARGIVVMNAPGGNTISTAEHAMAMLLSLSRNIPQATASMKAGEWERKKYTGVELDGKTLGIVGAAGRVGQQVARRARAFGMRILGADPFLSDDLARQLHIKPVTYDELFAQADYITLHTVLTDQTHHLISKEALDNCKKSVRIINCARGELIDEDALLEAIESGKVAGAALDVFQEEPPRKDHPLVNRPEVICTPHQGASTFEAQEKVARQIAGDLRDALLGKPVASALNLPPINAEYFDAVSPYLLLAERVGSLQAQLMGGNLHRIHNRYQGVIQEYATAPLTAAVLKGVFGHLSNEPVTLVNALLHAKNRHIDVEESKTSHEDYNNLVTVDVETSQENTSISATVLGRNDPRLIRIDDVEVKAKLEGHMLFLGNQDVPGVVGHMGNLLAEEGINIADMALGRKAQGGDAIMVFNIDAPVSEAILKKILSKDFVHWVKQVKL